MLQNSLFLTLFGVTGDLSRKKLLPALFSLFTQNALGDNFCLIGYGRRPWSQDDFRDFVTEAIKAHGNASDTQLHDFLSVCHYVEGGFDNPDGFEALAKQLDNLSHNSVMPSQRLFYLATAPEFFVPITTYLHAVGLSKIGENEMPRLALEKPFGENLATARDLNHHLNSLLSEKQLYRVDHYLEKYGVQNIAPFRFTNPTVQAIWNHEYIDHVQITIAEQEGIGTRGPYYDASGALRDVLQNHGLEIMALLTMAEPASQEATDFRLERTRSIQSFQPISLATGQYTGYQNEEKVAQNSQTETYAAVKFLVDMPNWHGVPFYIRTGKKLTTKATFITLCFKPAVTASLPKSEKPSTITFIIDPNFSIRHSVNLLKEKKELMLANETSPDAYEQLLKDFCSGDQSHFVGKEENEAAWQVLEPLLGELKATQPQPYSPDSWGPESADALIQLDGREWINLIP